MARIVFVMPRCRHDHVRGSHKQALSLAAEGHDVVLVAEDSVDGDYLGMRVIAARSPFNSLLRPVLNLPALYRQVKRLGGDLYVLRNPDTILLALLLRLSGTKVIYDTHEDFSIRPMIHDRLPRWSRRAVAIGVTALERLLARTVTAVTVTQSQQVDTIGGRVMLLPNAPLTKGAIIEQMPRAKRGEARTGLVFVYVGEITERRGIFRMLDLLESLNPEYSARLDLVGWFRFQDLERRAREHPGWQYVRFLGPQTHSQTLAIIRDADIGLAILDRVADYPTTSITKLFEYMQFGVPFIASDFPAWRISNEDVQPGLYIDPDSSRELISAATRLAGDPDLRASMGAAGRDHIRQSFNWETVVTPFIALVSEAVGEEQRT